MRICLVDWSCLDGQSNSIRYYSGTMSLRSVTLQGILNEAEFKDVHLLPILENNRKYTPPEIIRTINNQVMQLRPDVVGCSVDTQFLEVAVREAEAWKCEFDASLKVIMGGAHFNEPELHVTRAGQEYAVSSLLRQPISSTLSLNYGSGNQPIVDYVCYGHGGGLPGLIHSISRGQEPNVPGIYWRSGRHLHGKGKGFGPRLAKVPLIKSTDFSTGEHIIELTANDSCPGSCGYCSFEKGIRYGEEDVSLALLGAIDESTRECMFNDANPFRQERIGYYSHIFGRLRATGADRPCCFYAEPGAIATDAMKAWLSDLLGNRRNLVKSLFIGREVVREDAAEAIGRRTNGKCKSQAELDNELRNIEWLIASMARDNVHRRVEIAYVIAPTEDNTYDKRLFEDAVHLLTLGKSAGLKVHINLFPLKPFPGTEVCTRYAGQYEDIPSHMLPGLDASIWGRSFYDRAGLLYSRMNEAESRLNGEKKDAAYQSLLSDCACYLTYPPFITNPLPARAIRLIKS